MDRAKKGPAPGVPPGAGQDLSLSNESPSVAHTGVEGSKKDGGLLWADEVTVTKVDWLWKNWIPKGKFSILEGDPGTGKTTLAIDLLARYTTGKSMPGESSPSNGSPGNVLVYSTEDDISDTLLGRLSVAGADLKRVAFLKGLPRGKDADNRSVYRSVALPRDADFILKMIKESKAGLVLFDPLVGVLGGQDTHKDSDVRNALAPLSEASAKTGATILGIRHLNKKAGQSAIMRGGGSIAFSAAARAVLMLAADSSNEDRAILAVSKCNLAKKQKSWIVERSTQEGHGPGIYRMNWVGRSSVTADQLCGIGAPRPIETALDWVESQIPPSGIRSKDLQVLARQHDISKTTYDRAVARLSKQGMIRSRQVGGGKGSYYMIEWVNPPTIQ